MKHKYKIITKSKNFIYYVTEEESNTNWHFKIGLGVGVNMGGNSTFPKAETDEKSGLKVILKIKLGLRHLPNYMKLNTRIDSPYRMKDLESEYRKEIKQAMLKNTIKYENEIIPYYDYALVLWEELNDKEKFYLYETPNQEIGWFTATLDKKQTGLAMNVELVLQPMGKIDNQPPYLIVQNDYKDKRNHNWIKIRLNGEIINGVKPIFNEAEMQKVKYWIELNKLPILLYWTQEETGYLEITKLIKPIDENTEELGEWTRKMLKPENLIGPFNSTEEMMKNLWDTED